MTATSLRRLKISHVRNLHQVKLEKLGRVNVLFGPNGSGKTSVLEAVHLLGMARSFRGSTRSLITHGEQFCTVSGLLAPGNQNLGVQRGLGGEVRIRLGGSPLRTVAELANHLPLQVINADSFDLLTGSPGARRQFLDWGVFHVEQSFFGQWQRFQRALKQRNKLLRRDKMNDRELPGWSRELAQAGEALSEHRGAYFQRLSPGFLAIMSRLAPSLTGLELRYRRGWDKQLSYHEALDATLSTDKDKGYTHIGPQRADVRVLIDGRLAAETLSRGQQKLVVCGLKLAQGQLLAEADRKHCAYLIDDLPAELDRQHSELVCEILASISAQVFITCVERDDIGSVWPGSGLVDMSMFHVEHGEITGA